MDGREQHAVVEILNRVLSDNEVLYNKTRKYHWNVTGRMFHSIHELLEEQYTALAKAGDEIAERSRSLGAPSIGTLKEFLECTTLQEDAGQYPHADQMLANLVTDHESVIRALRQDIDKCEEYNDAGTADFLTQQMEDHEKMAWMLRAFLEDRTT
ncbi:MAG: DNA starvation/stationary phase protection protein [Chloroflexales bacterium]|nr:DNA starvation/stationary phase protection protein [Chloroflexales bacterium]